ncbi:MAG: hypothetical protein COA69_13530 [Robiginitomaculum sp.]|nr:MAG: hypothetical protein COA69_13530 [Robiginitomaculum sp.]
MAKTNVKAKPARKLTKAENSALVQEAKVAREAKLSSYDAVKRAEDNGFVLLDERITCGDFAPIYLRPSEILGIHPSMDCDLCVPQTSIFTKHVEDITVAQSSREVFKRLDHAANPCPF